MVRKTLYNTLGPEVVKYLQEHGEATVREIRIHFNKPEMRDLLLLLEIKGKIKRIMPPIIDEKAYRPFLSYKTIFRVAGNETEPQAKTFIL